MPDSLLPAVLIAFAPIGSITTDRFQLAVPFSVGRERENTLAIHDDKISKRHFEITHNHGAYWVKDLVSTNGTFLDGKRVEGIVRLSSGAVIRAGRAVLVFLENAADILRPPCADRFGMAGRFHASPLMDRLREASQSDKHVLLVGATGTGKELAARALCAMIGKPNRKGPLIARNCAQFVNRDEAKSTLFGVDKGIFSEVKKRPGLIADAEGGVLFLDEVHRLPEDVKGALLRVVEYGTYSRAGETMDRKADVRFILATNAPDTLPHDLTPRLRIETLPSLAERVADIPSIFNAVLGSALTKKHLDANEILPLIRADHYESMCLDGFEADNVRSLIDIADRIATAISSGADSITAVVRVFSDRYGNGPVARRIAGDDGGDKTGNYEPYKLQILQAYHECNGNVSMTERLHKSRGIQCTRKWLSVYLGKWGMGK